MFHHDNLRQSGRDHTDKRAELDMQVASPTRIGERLAWGVGGLITVSTLLLLGLLLYTSIGHPEQSDVAMERFLKFFNEVVKQTLVPVFVPLITYIFGHAQGRKSTES